MDKNGSLQAQEQLESSHYVKTLQKALKEVSDENEIVSSASQTNFQLRNRVTKLEALLAVAHEQIEQRNDAILELNEAYEVNCPLPQEILTFQTTLELLEEKEQEEAEESNQGQ